MSTGGNCVTLGANKLFYKVNFNACIFKLHEKSTETNNVADNPLLVHGEEKWKLIGAVLGCDHLKRIKSCGFAASFNKALHHLVIWDAEEAAEKLRKREKLIMTDDHKIKLNKPVILLAFPPVINENDKAAPLSNLENNNEWGVKIELEVDLIRFSPVSMD